MEYPTSCDTFVCLPPLTEMHAVIFGKNSDRPADEVQEIAFYPSSTNSQNDKLMCTYIEVDQVPETLAVILSKPNWMWGAEMGANCCGVCIGNEAIWAKVEAEEERKLLGMDLVRLGLERGKSAREALDVITFLLQTHGQGGPCSNTQDLTYHNSFLIADHKEAWVLETVNKYWVAEHVKEGYRNISNGLTIETQIDLMSDGLKEEAQKHFGWNPSTEFNFAKIFSYGESCGRFRQGRELLRKASVDKNFDAQRMMCILRDHEINMGGYGGGFATTSSQVSVLKSSEDCLHMFTGTADSVHSVFKPFTFSPSMSKNTTQMTESSSDSHPQKHELYRVHEGSYNHIRRNRQVQEEMSKLEEGFLKLTRESNCDKRTDIFREAVQSEMLIYSKLKSQ